MTCDRHLRQFALALCAALCAVRAEPEVQGDFEKKVSILLREEPESPKCFAESKNDFTCFWEEDAGPVALYSFTYSYQNQESNRCPLSAVPAPGGGGKMLFLCHLNQIKHFVPMDVSVRRDGELIHKRSLMVELVFLLDPPANVTANGTGQQGQLDVRWSRPQLKHMEDSMVYEVRYRPARGHAWQVEKAPAVRGVVLRGLQPGTGYKVQVRVKLDGVTYSGFWSSWSDPVSVETLPAEFDPLILTLTLIITFILVVLWLTTVLSHRRFLTKKIWPTIPTPDSKFQGLFTLHDGDFEEWLGHTNSGLWLSPASVCSEERPSPLEVLSELSLGPAPTSPPPRAADGRQDEEEEEEVVVERSMAEGPERGGPRVTPGWRAVPHDLWLMERLRARPAPCSQSSPLESQDTYVSLSNHHHHHQHQHQRPGERPEEATPPEASDVGSAPPSSRSGLSSGASLGRPDPRWPPEGLGYAYMAVADSGVSMGYSPMSWPDGDADAALYANEYKNDRPGIRPKSAQLHINC